MREPFQGGWHKCPICGKKFRISAGESDWTFIKWKKGKRVYFCSWKCVRRKEKEEADDREAEGAP